MQRACEVRGSAAVSATDLQHLLAAQIDLGHLDAVVQVDAGSRLGSSDAPVADPSADLSHRPS